MICIIADEVTHEHANKKVFLACLRFLQNIGVNVTVQEFFLDSVHIQGSAIDKNIAEHVLNNLKKHNINIQNCRTQSYLNQIQLKAEYTHSRNHIVNLAIIHACKNLFIKNLLHY